MESRDLVFYNFLDLRCFGFDWGPGGTGPYHVGKKAEENRMELGGTSLRRDDLEKGYYLESRDLVFYIFLVAWWVADCEGLGYCYG